MANLPPILTQAARTVSDIYDNLAEVAAELTQPKTAALDNLTKKLSKDIDQLNNQELRDLMIKISIEAYTLSLAREQSALRDSCAESLYKEKLAKTFALAEGTQEFRKNQSILESMDTQAVSMLFKTATGILKAKTEEAHRIVSVISSILISRAADAKLTYNPRSELDTISLVEEE